MEMYFLVQIKFTNNAWDKGVVVKQTLDEARQSFHAYLGAYGYGHDPDTTYVQCMVIDAQGRVRDSVIDDRYVVESAEETEE